MPDRLPTPNASSRDAADRALLVQRMRDHGFTVTHFGNGENAFTLRAPLGCVIEIFREVGDEVQLPPSLESRCVMYVEELGSGVCYRRVFGTVLSALQWFRGVKRAANGMDVLPMDVKAFGGDPLRFGWVEDAVGSERAGDPAQ